jgi:hypothetical protein
MEENKYPLYPTLPEAAMEEAQHLMDGFKERMTKLSEEVLGDLYCHVSAYIESDHWSNFRNQILDGLCNYENRKIHGQYDFARIRQAILKEHRDAIIEDLNQDMLKEIAALKEQIRFMDECRNSQRY